MSAPDDLLAAAFRFWSLPFLITQGVAAIDCSLAGELEPPTASGAATTLLVALILGAWAFPLNRWLMAA